MSSNTTAYDSTNLPVRGSAIALTFYNGFFNQHFSFDANEFSAVYGMFKGLRLNDNNTYTLTFSILAEAKMTGVNPIDMVKSLITKDGLKLNMQTTTLFNRTRKKTSFIGYRITSELNPYIDHLLVE